MNYSRREWCETICRMLAISATAPATRGLAFEPRSEFPGDGSRGVYRADALVTILGVPIFTARGVGRAVSSVREEVRGNQRTVALWFAGGSDTARTHGFRYTGSTEETNVHDGRELIQSTSFGFVTTSQSEESFEQARRRITDGERDRQPFVVVEEVHGANCVRFQKAFVAAPELPVSGFRRLAAEVRSLFATADVSKREIACETPGVPWTFLYTMLTVLRSADGRSTAEYRHEEKRYRLVAEKSRDARAGSAFLAKNLIRNPAAVSRVTGQIRDLEAAKTSTFRLWMEDGSDVPVRIEFSPRSYLRISLEADPEMNRVARSEEDM